MFSRSVMSNSLQPHGLQHIRLPCSSPSPGACSNSCPLSLPSNHLILCHLFSSCLQILPSIRVFSNESAHHIRWPKYWSFSISPSNEYSELISFRIYWFDLLAIQGTRVFSSTAVQKHQFFSTQPSFWSSSHIHTWLLEKPKL